MYVQCGVFVLTGHLSQVRLNSEECADALKRWVGHLCSPQVNQKSKALLVLLSLGCFSSVAETLHRCVQSAWPVPVATTSHFTPLEALLGGGGPQCLAWKEKRAF